MKRSARWFFLAVLGAAVVMLTGSGLISLLSDSVTVTGNRAESGTLGSHDVQAAVSSDCSTATYSDGPIPAAIDVVLDLSTTEPLSPVVICVKNNGSVFTHLTMHFDNVLDVEVGDCTPSEEAEDTTCEDGDAGELAGALALLPSSSCTTVTYSAAIPFQSFLDDFSLSFFGVSPGSTCTVTLTPSVSEDASNSVLAAAQTDQLTWDIVFTLSDSLISVP